MPLVFLCKWAMIASALWYSERGSSLSTGGKSSGVVFPRFAEPPPDNGTLVGGSGASPSFELEAADGPTFAEPVAAYTVESLSCWLSKASDKISVVATCSSISLATAEQRAAGYELVAASLSPQGFA